MSRQIKYQIDENYLRSKLNTEEGSVTEEAWQKFDQYYSSHKTASPERSWKDFHLNINKTYLLPGVFAGMIILFSLLLYNFISIRVNKKEVNKVGDEKQVLSAGIKTPMQPKVSVQQNQIKIKPVEKTETPSQIEIKNEPQAITKSANNLINTSDDPNTQLASEVTKYEKPIKKKRRLKKDTLVIKEITPEIKPISITSEPEPVEQENVPD